MGQDLKLQDIVETVRIVDTSQHCRTSNHRSNGLTGQSDVLMSLSLPLQLLEAQLGLLSFQQLQQLLWQLQLLDRLVSAVLPWQCGVALMTEARWDATMKKPPLAQPPLQKAYTLACLSLRKMGL